MTAVPIVSAQSAVRREPEHRRTLQKVRRGSRLARRDWFAHFSWVQGRRLLLAMRIYVKGLRKTGQRTGARGTLSFGAQRLLELLVSVAARRRGQLEPGAAWLARELGVPAKSIHAWKEQLKRHGFLNWQRRYVETGLPGQRGPQVTQTTNAYFLSIPDAAEAALRNRLGPKGAAGSKSEKVERTDPALAAALANLGNAVQDDADRARKAHDPT